MSTVAALLRDAAAGEAATWPRFADLRRPGLVTHPIPFFGPVQTARVLTVGVNPSWTEFDGRGWPAHLTPAEHADRLIRYFHRPAGVPPHAWFAKWAPALAELGVRHGVEAAHLDVSPRARHAMGQCAVDRFLAMLEHDAGWFFRTLALCDRAALLLLAGTATKAHYLHRFLARVEPAHAFRIVITAQTRGAGPVAFGTVEGAGRSIPFFFCGVSPSARDPSALARRVAEHRDRLTGVIGAAPTLP